jgi:hypothetical protein
VAAPMPLAVRRYLEGLLTIAGLPLGSAEQEHVLEELFDRLNRFTLQVYLNSLAPTSRAMVEQMAAEQRTQFEVEQFIHDHVPDLAQAHTNALREFRRQYLREVAAARKK